MPTRPFAPGEIETALARVTAALARGEDRPGQVQMALAVADAIETHRPLVVQAGTGTGKSLAYLVPAVLSGRKVVVATATKALQDQLAGKDLPFLAEHLDRPFTFAVLKGRSNYACRQRVHEATTSDTQLTLEGTTDRSLTEQVRAIAEWAEASPTGDRAELDHEPSARAWAAVSVGPRECPGAASCPRGHDCFAEQARAAAAGADVVVVNTHLYSLSVEAGGALLPEHEVVVIDEAHQFEDVVSATFGLELTGHRLTNLARVTGAIVEDPKTVTELDGDATRLVEILSDHVGRRLRGQMDAELAEVLLRVRGHVDVVLAALRAVPDDGPGDVGARKQRALKVAGTLVDDLDWILDPPPSHAVWVEGTEAAPVLKGAPIDVAEALRDSVWQAATVVLTSATVPAGLGARLGLEPGSFTELDVGSPFDYERHALLYCAAHLPDPRSSAYEAQLHDELAALITAAGGRTLALFTSYRAMDVATEALRARLDTEVLSQNDLPKPALIRRFSEDESTSLFATMGFWQGIDVPGRSLALVTIDRLPFPRPDEPLLQARRERARADAFRVVDLPRAATMLAQGAGRLIRSAADRGVVAVLDPRLATNASYRWDIVTALPPMRRTRDRSEAEAFLAEIASDPPTT
ncbi:MAG TPA: ATP-dependent DNA helicase [Acidimicrobiales bacterium]|nr:ATP-dependent DNA helicase [Acidimicrobiales bacterium]